ncbi:MAG: thioesterase family protein, partial [Pseudomonadota bacterium]
MALVVGRTRVNVWECDEIGHVNVRFYGEKLDQGLPVFLHYLGLTPARLADEGLSVAVTAHHVRYIRELTGGDNLLLEVQVMGGDSHTEALIGKARRGKPEVMQEHRQAL